VGAQRSIPTHGPGPLVAAVGALLQVQRAEIGGQPPRDRHAAP
jgi:hypothetical protein